MKSVCIVMILQEMKLWEQNWEQGVFRPLGGNRYLGPLGVYILGNDTYNTCLSISQSVCVHTGLGHNTDGVVSSMLCFVWPFSSSFVFLFRVRFVKFHRFLAAAVGVHALGCQFSPGPCAFALAHGSFASTFSPSCFAA